MTQAERNSAVDGGWAKGWVRGWEVGREGEGILREFRRDRIQGLEEFDGSRVRIGTQPDAHVVGSLPSRRHRRGRRGNRPAPVHHSSSGSFSDFLVLSVRRYRRAVVL